MSPPAARWRRGLGGRATTIAGAAVAVAVILGAVGIAFAVVDATPLAELIATRSLASGTIVSALAIAVGSSFIACAGYVWAMRGVALEPSG